MLEYVRLVCVPARMGVLKPVGRVQRKSVDSMGGSPDDLEVLGSVDIATGTPYTRNFANFGSN